ncbi:hypothetical protein C5F44_04690 [Fuscovulum blasticum DSM 2131]|uniref:UPF0102 protein C5F44_04690 n=2 Tax=Fuscovulum blasticum TaxID=1075 RepID=A0A2T4JCN3_FUSBL|nr:hypothetical protein C5F44_04690 [Fuscovulum blasticum DSM 2131]
MPLDFGFDTGAAGLPVALAPERRRRADRGRMAYLSGLAAEDAVARRYEAAGLPVIARRWRGRSGEVDLVARDGETVVFIEVKSAATHAIAAEYLTRAQYDRIARTVADFVDGEPAGQMTEVRIDLALVDQTGRVEVTENIWFD